MGGLIHALRPRPALARNMAPSLLLLSLPWPVRSGPLHRCWELLQRQLQQNWSGFASPQWGKERSRGKRVGEDFRVVGQKQRMLFGCFINFFFFFETVSVA